MKRKSRPRTRRTTTKSVLRLPDLEHAKAAVLNSLDAQRGYRHAIDEFVDWYCSEPRLAFNRIVVLRYRSHLESRQLAPGTINLRRALRALLLACGLRRHEAVALTLDHLQQREDHWAIVDLVGKAGTCELSPYPANEFSSAVNDRIGRFA